MSDNGHVSVSPRSELLWVRYPISDTLFRQGKFSRPQVLILFAAYYGRLREHTAWDDLLDKRQVTGLVRVAYWVDESY